MKGIAFKEWRTEKLRLMAIVTAAVASLVLGGSASPYPIEDAKAAIAVAKDVCHDKPLHTWDWTATERADGAVWIASKSLPGGAILSVMVPIKGLYPSEILTCRRLIPDRTARP